LPSAFDHSTIVTKNNFRNIKPPKGRATKDASETALNDEQATRDEHLDGSIEIGVFGEMRRKVKLTRHHSTKLQRASVVRRGANEDLSKRGEKVGVATSNLIHLLISMLLSFT
jgi:hypothetical protein